MNAFHDWPYSGSGSSSGYCNSSPEVSSVGSLKEYVALRDFEEDESNSDANGPEVGTIASSQLADRRRVVLPDTGGWACSLTFQAWAFSKSKETYHNRRAACARD